ncbi:MAG: MarR family transcriptional regulator [Candidatus Lokiarchaeota archaeon]|nr:MarR family transcriptional regulator [Candidatus Lokiarchaeota archaeon]
MKIKNPPDQLPSSDVAILGILSGSERALTGKEVNMVIAMAHYSDWVNIEFSTAYNCLKRLEEYGYVRGEYKTRNQRRNKEFQLTEKGRNILENEIEWRLSIPKKAINEIDLAIKYLTILPPKKVLLALESYINHLEKDFIYYEEMIDGLKNAKPGEQVNHIPITKLNIDTLPLVIALFERPYRELLARRDWFKGFLSEIKKYYNQLGNSK